VREIRFIINIEKRNMRNQSQYEEKLNLKRINLLSSTTHKAYEIKEIF
jgi:hypothetical protein